MKLTCDLCGGELEVKAAGAVCRNCGLEYSKERLMEKQSEIRPPVTGTPPVTEIPPIRDESSGKQSVVAARKAKKEQKKMKIMWIILALIGVVAFAGGLMESGIVFVVCLAALLITLFVFKPWNVYGGKAI